MSRSAARTALRSRAVAVGVAVAFFGAPACVGSGDDNLVPAPVADAGSGPTRDATMASSDASPPDACSPDSATCNSCVAPSVDPYNACSPYASGCIPFDGARVPTHPTL